ncbi:MAG: hypothetical protein ABSA79_12260 [Candidatus Bathyarchaeia archaeon]|jgi:hypothetical protein
MNKQEASSFLKELLTKCKMDSDSFILVEPNPKDTLSTGYKVRVKTILNNECRKQIREITKKYDLAVIEEEVQIIIYKPKSKNSGNLILK